MMKVMFLVATILGADGISVGELRLGPVSVEMCAAMLEEIHSAGGELADGVSLGEMKCISAEGARQ